MGEGESAPKTLDNDERYIAILNELKEKHGTEVTETELVALAHDEFLFKYPRDGINYGIRISGK